MLDIRAIAEALRQEGWWTGLDVLDKGLLQALLLEVRQLCEMDAMQRARVGRGSQQQQASEIRSDSIYWLGGDTDAQREYLAQMEVLRRALNHELFLGLFEYEAHFAHYPPDAFYRQHRDSFAGANNRLVSVVTYLNADWPDNAGGELVVYAPDDAQVAAHIKPEAGTVVVFLSETVMHEVLPANRHRYSIAGWFRVNASHSHRIDLMG